MIGIFYGSTTGNTESLAHEIASQLGIDAADVHNVAQASAEWIDRYDTLLLGSSTWGVGDLQDDWYTFVDELKTKNLSGKKIGLFGCGDSASYPDSFGEAIAVLYEALAESGCTFIGQMPASDYPATESRAFQGQTALGLLADDDAPEKSAERMKTWVTALQNA